MATLIGLREMSDMELMEIADAVNAEVKRRNDALGVGATDEYPNQKLNETDEGALKVAMRRDGNNIFFNFGKPVAWLALPVDAALQLSLAIAEKCK